MKFKFPTTLLGLYGAAFFERGAKCEILNQYLENNLKYLENHRYEIYSAFRNTI